MCSHYKPVTDPNKLSRAFGVEGTNSLVKPDIWPSYEGLFVRPHPFADVGDEAVPNREAVLGRWGLIPHWSKDGKVRATFNARSETVPIKPTFRDAWKHNQRCIIPAISIYEPDWRSGKAVAAEISRKDGLPMGIAGLWSTWKSSAGEVDSYTMLTINADEHEVFGLLHKPQDEKRMAVILEEDDYEIWLKGSVFDAQSLLRQYSATLLCIQHQGC